METMGTETRAFLRASNATMAALGSLLRKGTVVVAVRSVRGVAVLAKFLMDLLENPTKSRKEWMYMLS